MSQFFRGFLVIMIILGIATVAVAQMDALKSSSYYALRGQRIEPASQPNTLSPKQMSDLIYYNQQRNDMLKAELARAHRDIQELGRQVKEMNTSLTQFKNYYFRQM